VLRSLARSDPPGCVRVSRLLGCMRVGAQGAHVCLVLDRLADSLQARLASIRMAPAALPVPPRDVHVRRLRKTGAQVAGALAHVHAQGLSHGRLSPRHLVYERPTAAHSGCGLRVVDFCGAGGAAAGEAADGAAWPYRAPEQLFGLQVGPPADLWALGVTLAEAALRRPVFASQLASPAALLRGLVAELGAPPPASLFAAAPRAHQACAEAGIQLAADNLADEPPPRGRLLSDLGRVDAQLAAFVAALLRYDPARRLTAAQALAHPFIAALGPAPVPSPHARAQPSACDRLRALVLSPARAPGGGADVAVAAAAAPEAEAEVAPPAALHNTRSRAPARTSPLQDLPCTPAAPSRSGGVSSEPSSDRLAGATTPGTDEAEAASPPPADHPHDDAAAHSPMAQSPASPAAFSMGAARACVEQLLCTWADAGEEHSARAAPPAAPQAAAVALWPAEAEEEAGEGAAAAAVTSHKGTAAVASAGASGGAQLPGRKSHRRALTRSRLADSGVAAAAGAPTPSASAAACPDPFSEGATFASAAAARAAAEAHEAAETAAAAAAVVALQPVPVRRSVTPPPPKRKRDEPAPRRASAGAGAGGAAPTEPAAPRSRRKSEAPAPQPAPALQGKRERKSVTPWWVVSA